MLMSRDGSAMEKTKQERVAIGARLREARENAGVSLEDAAEAAGAQVAAISAWERGRSSPSLVQYKGLLACYGIMGHRVLFGAHLLELTEEEAAELQRASRSFSVGLQRRTSLWLTMMAKYGTTQAVRAPAS
jgi:transcriptional regulator with XRE-family HTH domain